MQRTSWLGTLAAAGLGFGIATLVAAPPWPVSPARAGERAREIFASADPLGRVADLGALLVRVEPDALPGLRAAFDASTLDVGDPELALFAGWWARFDPLAAEEWALSDWRAKSPGVFVAVYRSWAHSDPEQAWARAQKIDTASLRWAASEAAINGWDESDPAGLESFVRELPNGAPQQTAAEFLARRRVLALGGEQAFRWAETLPDDGLRDLLRVRVASSTAEFEPETAARWAEPRIAAAERPTGLPRRIGTRWVRRDPQAAMAWLASLPDGQDRDDGVTESFRDWLRTDHMAARTWLESTALARWNEPAFGIFARGVLAFEDTRKALDLVGRFEDEERRNYFTTVIARTWLERNREAAEPWLEQADIPEDVRKRASMVSNRRQRLEQRRDRIRMQRRWAAERNLEFDDAPLDGEAGDAEPEPGAAPAT